MISVVIVQSMSLLHYYWLTSLVYQGFTLVLNMIIFPQSGEVTGPILPLLRGDSTWHIIYTSWQVILRYLTGKLDNLHKCRDGYIWVLLAIFSRMTNIYRILPRRWFTRGSDTSIHMRCCLLFWIKISHWHNGDSIDSFLTSHFFFTNLN